MPHRHIARIMLAAFLVLALPCCMLGPDYARPDVSVQLPAKFDLPAGWKVAQPRGAGHSGEWWKPFKDAQLNRLMQKAEANNQELKAAFSRVEQSRAIAGIARSELFPDLSFDPQASRERRSANSFNNNSGTAGATTTRLALPFQMQYEIDLWGQIRRGVEAANSDTAASEAELLQLLLMLRAELANSYFILRSLDAEIVIFRNAIGLRRKSLELNRLRFEAGDTDEVDVSRAATELASTEAELVGLTRRRSDLEDAIAVLLGEPSSGFHLAPNPLQEEPPRVPVSVPSELLERRPDVAQAERIMAAENARIGVAEAAFYPSVRLSAVAGLESAHASDLFDIASRTWGLGPQLSLPIFEGGRNQAELRRSHARYDESVAGYRQTILEAVSEVDRSLTGVALLNEQASAQARTVEAASRTFELSQDRYDAGLIDYFDVVDAQRTLLDAEQEASRVTGARYVAAVTLARALGGAW